MRTKEQVQTALNDMRLLKELDHTNIIKCYGLYKQEIDGHEEKSSEKTLQKNAKVVYWAILDSFSLPTDLESWFSIEGNKYTEESVIKVIKSLLSTLKYASSKSISHNQFNLTSILTDLKIFGFSSDPLQGQCQHASLYFLAPEAIDPKAFENKEIWQRDIWAIGVLTYVLLMGSYPFDGSTDTEVKYQIK